MDGTFRLFRWWLGVLAVAALAFGLSLVLAPDAMARLFGGLYLSEPSGITDFGAEAAEYVQFVTAVMGAVMAGWAAMILGIVVFMLRPGRRDAWWVLTVSLVVWFVPDTAYSIWSGFWQNAVFNVIPLVLFAVPLVGTYRFTKTPGTRSDEPAVA